MTNTQSNGVATDRLLKPVAANMVYRHLWQQSASGVFEVAA